MRPLLDGWYPGLGEVEALKRMPAPVRKFLSDAVARDPSFAEEYIVPRLSQPNPYSMIVSDILAALDVHEDKAISGYLGAVDSRWISNLGDAATNAIQALMAKAAATQASQAAMQSLSAQDRRALTTIGIPGFMDQLRTLTSDPAIIAQGQAIEQRAINGQQAHRDAETVPAKSDAAALIASLQKAKADAALAARRAMTPQQAIQASQAALLPPAPPPAPVRDVTGRIVQTASDAAAAAAKAKADADALAAEAASNTAMKATADVRAAALWKAKIDDIVARVSRGEPVARAEYADAYSIIKPGGGHPYVDWTAYEAANGRVHSSWLSKIATPFLAVAGAVLAPFTGGASLAAASAISGVIKATQAAGQATIARNAAAYNAPQQAAAAQQQQSAAAAQLDQFFAANQPWFTQHGITQAAWSAMTTDQKIAILNAGVTGQPVQNVPSSSSSQTPAQAYAASAGASQDQGSGGSSSGGTYPDGSSSSGGFSPYGAQPGAAPGAQVATAGMLGGPILPILAVGAGLALMFGKPVKGGRRTRRNPARKSRRYRWSA
jgi:hypothetical protein